MNILECRHQTLRPDQSRADHVALLSSTRLTAAVAPLGVSYPPAQSYSYSTLPNPYGQPERPTLPPSRSQADLIYGQTRGQEGSNPYRRNSGSFDPHTSPSYAQLPRRSSVLAYDDDETQAPLYTQSPMSQHSARDALASGRGYRSR